MAARKGKENQTVTIRFQGQGGGKGGRQVECGGEEGAGEGGWWGGGLQTVAPSP